MTYELILSPNAERDLLGLPGPVVAEVLDRLDELAAGPSRVSTRSRDPYPRNCQLFEFTVDHAAFRWELTVLFQYSPDEIHLYVTGIGKVWRDRTDPT